MTINLEACGGYEHTDDGIGFRPQIRLNDTVIWEGDTLVPFEHGDYDDVQEARAKNIAEDHLIEKLTALFA